MNFHRIQHRVALGIAAFATALASGCHQASTVMPTASQSIFVPLIIATPNVVSTRIGPIINVTIGGATIPLLLDTGSSGIRVLAPSLASAGGSYSSQPGLSFNQTFGTQGGTLREYVGTVASSDIRLGKDLGEQNFQLVTQVCDFPATSTPPPSCASANQINQEQAQLHADGIFGVRPVANSAPVYEPLALFPNPYSTGFIVSFEGRQLKIGITDSDRANFNMYKVGTVTPSIGPAVWKQTLLPWSVIYDGTPFTPRGGALIDTGGQQAHLYLVGAPPSGIPMNTLTSLSAGTSISIILGTVNLKLTAGSCASNVVNVWFGSPPAGTTSSFGINPFFDYDVLYDLQNGAIGFRPDAASQACSP
jgi:hypothetical protein